MMIEKIAIIGTGAIGCGLGFLLNRAGYKVTLIGRPAQVRAIQTNGLNVQGYAGAVTVKLDASEKLNFRPDLVLLAVKTQDIDNALQENLGYLNEAPLVTLQNGVRSDDLAAGFLAKENIISAVGLLHANYLEEGSVTLMYEGGLIVGSPFVKRGPLISQISDILNRAIPTSISENIKGAHWLKLIANLNNALPALINGTFHQVYGNPFLARLAIRMMREGLNATKQAGIHLESLPDVSLSLMQVINFLPVSIAAKVTAARIARMKTRWPLLGSTLQSLRRRRSTEIDYLNGEIVRLGEKVGVSTPLNARVVHLVHQVEQTGTFFSVEEIPQVFQ